jgi:selenophosphate synthase
MDFWERVAHYRELGLDPLKWVAGCAVKVDLVSVVYPALRMIRPDLERWGVMLGHREDADIFPCTENETIIERRVVYDLETPEVDLEGLRRLNPDRAISLIQVHQRKAESPDAFAQVMRNVYRHIGDAKLRFTVGKGHSIITTYEDAQFALFDFIKQAEGKPRGYTLANNDTIQVIDPTEDPGSEVQAFAAVSNSLNDLLSLGCYQNLRLYPVYDSATREMAAVIGSHMKAFASKYGMTVCSDGALGIGRLLIGATVVGDSFKEPPTFYDKLEKGMCVLISRPLGDLAPVNVYLSCLADEDYHTKFESLGLSLDDARRTKDAVVALMTLPNLKIAEIINKHCPDYGEPFNPRKHIACTGDVSGPGILIFKETAELAKVDIRLDKIPLKYPAYVSFASKNFLLDNGTAGTNGAVAIMAMKDVIDSIYVELEQAGYEPEIIGTVLGKGDGKLLVGPEVREIVASKGLLDEFTIEEDRGKIAAQG